MTRVVSLRTPPRCVRSGPTLWLWLKGRGLEPGSELVVKDFDGIEQGFEVEDDGTVNGLKYRLPESGEAAFDVSGTSGDGETFDGEIVISGPT